MFTKGIVDNIILRIWDHGCKKMNKTFFRITSHFTFYSLMISIILNAFVVNKLKLLIHFVGKVLPLVLI